MSRCNRITPTKKECKIYMWNKENRIKEVLEYINEKTKEELNEKIIKYKIFPLQEEMELAQKVCYLPIFDKEKINSYDKNNYLHSNIINACDIIKNCKIMDQKEFLKKYTTIDDNFIDDFYNIFNEEYMERYNEFLIDSEILIKWLNIKNRRVFHDTIKRSYVLNKDYIIKNVKKSSGSGGQNFQKIYLTLESSKLLSLLTKSKTSYKIRQYFIDIEYTLYKYQNYIIQGLNNKIKQLENNQKPKINSEKGIIYAHDNSI
jgi:phage anti-repressor protein